LLHWLNPVDHAEKCKAAARGLTAPFNAALAALDLHVGNLNLDEVNVTPSCARDAFAQRRRQRMILMQHHRDLAVARLSTTSRCSRIRSTEAFFGTHDSADSAMTRVLSQFHGVVHDLEQNFVFALKVW